MTDKAPELLPCPFCGEKGKPIFYKGRGVKCARCKSWGPDPMEPRADWNARATLAPADVMADPRIKALVKAVRHEREMVCQDFAMQLAASQAVDAALASITDTPEGT